MPRIFGRETTQPYGAMGILAEELQRSIEPSHKALGWNMANDDRVSDARAAHFYEFGNFPSSGRSLIQAIEHYMDEWIALQPPHLTYLSACNSQNFVPGQPDFLLCHVLNVSSLLRRIRGKAGLEFGLDVESFRGMETAILDRRMPGDKVKRLIEQLFEASFRLQRNRPVFAARWTDFEQHVSPNEPETWHRAVGVWRGQNSVQMVIRYSAQTIQSRTGALYGNLAATLLRPTQLDAGNYQYHYPSLASLPVEKGGFAMSLRDTSNTKLPLVSEYIHAPFRFEYEDWLGPSWLGETDGGLADFRSQHQERLDEAQK